MVQAEGGSVQYQSQSSVFLERSFFSLLNFSESLHAEKRPIDRAFYPSIPPLSHLRRGCKQKATSYFSFCGSRNVNIGGGGCQTAFSTDISQYAATHDDDLLSTKRSFSAGSLAAETQSE